MPHNFNKLHLKYDMFALCKKILHENLDKSGLSYNLLGVNEVEILEPISPEKFQELNDSLGVYGIEMVEGSKNVLIQRIKDTIIEMVNVEEDLPQAKISAYLADKLNYSYGYISNLFSEVTYTSIENFIILQKIERAKQLITTNELTFKEIAWKLNYSSSSHFCTQFKNVTGLTPRAFQRIINQRRNKETV